MSDVQRNLLLLENVQKGEEGALEELMQENIGLVKSIALRYKGRGTDYEDLVQIGCIGMIKAARSFDFTYKTTLRDDGPIKVSRTLRKLGAEAMREQERIRKEEGREPRISELAKCCAVGEEELVQALEAVYPVHSLYEAAGKGEDGRLLDLLPEEDEQLEKITDRLALRQAVSELGELQRQIVYLRYDKELSQEQTGRILGISQVKVSREEKKIIEELRKKL